MNTKFKVGQKVKAIARDANVFVGETYTVSRVDTDATIKVTLPSGEESLWCSEEHFELVATDTLNYSIERTGNETRVTVHGVMSNEKVAQILAIVQ